MSFAELLSYISTLTVFIPFLYCLSALKRGDKFVIPLFVLLCISILTSTVAEYYIQVGRQTALFLNVYTYFEFIGISFIYAALLPHWKKGVYFVMALYSVFYIVDSYWIENIAEIQDYPLVVESVIVIGYCTAYFFHSLKEVGHDYSLIRDGKFWVNIAFISYFVYSIGLFVIVNHIFTELEPATAQALWNIHNINYIIKNLLLGVGIYCISKTARPPFELFGADEKWWQRLPPNPAKDVTAHT